MQPSMLVFTVTRATLSCGEPASQAAEPHGLGTGGFPPVPWSASFAAANGASEFETSLSNGDSVSRLTASEGLGIEPGPTSGSVLGADAEALASGSGVMDGAPDGAAGLHALPKVATWSAKSMAVADI